MELTNSDRASCGERSFCDPIQNPVHHQISHLRKALEPMSGFGNGLTSPGVARTIIAYPWLSAEKPISFRDRKIELLPGTKNFHASGLFKPS